MKNSYVVDTMGLVLWLEKRRLSPIVRKIFEGVENNEINIVIPAIVLGEVGYLFERKRIDVKLSDVQKLSKKFTNIKIEPLTAEIIIESFEIKDINELHDRLISGTGKFLGHEIISNDPVISASKYVKTIW